jgi:hypothetical protein
MDTSTPTLHENNVSKRVDGATTDGNNNMQSLIDHQQDSSTTKVASGVNPAITQSASYSSSSSGSSPNSTNAAVLSSFDDHETAMDTQNLSGSSVVVNGDTTRNLESDQRRENKVVVVSSVAQLADASVDNVPTEKNSTSVTSLSDKIDSTTNDSIPITTTTLLSKEQRARMLLTIITRDDISSDVYNTTTDSSSATTAYTPNSMLISESFYDDNLISPQSKATTQPSNYYDTNQHPFEEQHQHTVPPIVSSRNQQVNDTVHVSSLNCVAAIVANELSTSDNVLDSSNMDKFPSDKPRDAIDDVTSTMNIPCKSRGNVSDNNGNSDSDKIRNRRNDGNDAIYSQQQETYTSDNNITDESHLNNTHGSDHAGIDNTPNNDDDNNNLPATTTTTNDNTSESSPSNERSISYAEIRYSMESFHAIVQPGR